MRRRVSWINRRPVDAGKFARDVLGGSGRRRLPHRVDPGRFRPERRPSSDVVVVVCNRVGEIRISAASSEGRRSSRKRRPSSPSSRRGQRSSCLRIALARLEAQGSSRRRRRSAPRADRRCARLCRLCSKPPLKGQFAHCSRSARSWPGVAEGRVAEVVGQEMASTRSSLRSRATGDTAGDLRHFDAVGEAGAEQVAFRD